MKYFAIVLLALFACAMAVENTEKAKRDILYGTYPYNFGYARSYIPGVSAYSAAYPYSYNYGAFPYGSYQYGYNYPVVY